MNLSMKLIIIGPQASGKGTQAILLSDELSIPHISTGDILRQNIKDNTELGKIALEYINKGDLIPDEVINDVVEKRINEEDCKNGFILDGYPRNPNQAAKLDEITKIDYVIEVDISDEEAVKRIGMRRTCEGCGAIYSTYDSDYEDKCKKCGGRLIIRDDDKEEAVRKRLEIYHDETEPVLAYYKKTGKLLKIDGERPIKEIFRDIIKRIK
jgi:adenylate kinase